MGKWCFLEIMIELHGTKISVARDGVQRVRQVYYVDDVGMVDDVPRLSTGINGRRVERVDLEAEQAPEGRQFIVTVTYEGMASKSLSHKSYSWRREDSADPIVTNPNFEAIVKRYGGQKMDPAGRDYVWPELKAKRGTVKNPMEGVESFLSLGGEWQETEAVEDIPEDLFVGMWSLVDEVPGGLPTPRGRLWLVMPPSAEQRGACYVIMRAWKLTGEMDAMRLEAARMIYRPTAG